MLCERLLKQGRQELILGVEVVVEGSDRDICGVGDLGDRRRVVAPAPRRGAVLRRAARCACAPCAARCVHGRPWSQASRWALRQYAPEPLTEYTLTIDFLFSHGCKFAAMTTSSSTSSQQGAFDEEVPVLIIGGGGAGLTASMLLSGLGVEHLLVSALPETSILPKAHVLNMRTMEILEDAGVAGRSRSAARRRMQMAATAFYAGFAGR